MSEARRLAWVPLRDGHAVPLHDLDLGDPDLATLKKGVRSVIKNPDHEVSHSSVLNAVAKALGFRGGFAGMREQMRPLHEFMRRHELITAADLINCQSNDFAFHLRRRAVADRIFERRPKRIFTGYDYDWAALSDYDTAPRSLIGAPVPKTNIEPYLYRNRFDLLGFWNLIGDGLTEPSDRVNLVECTYAVKGHANAAEKQRRRDVFLAFRKVLDRSQHGWVDVVPFNDNLVFLRGRRGTYDVVFKELRDVAPPERREPRLHPDFCPAFLQGKHAVATKMWFRHGWEERDRHYAEVYFYERGGHPEVYPGQDAVLETYLRRSEQGSPPRMIEKPGLLSTLREVAIGDRRLAVSELITIGEYRFFLGKTDYSDRRRGDEWHRGNDDPDHHPAAVTWLDAAAYCAWLERVTGQPVRLLSPEEYNAVLGQPDEGRDDVRRSCISWAQPWSGVIGQPAPARFLDAVPSEVTPSGLHRIAAWDFLEWRDNETAASPYGWWPIGAESWGAYKKCKIGFRIVIEIPGGAR